MDQRKASAVEIFRRYGRRTEYGAGVVSMMQNPVLARLEGAQNVLIAGAGGGFDVYAGLPLAFALEAQGKTVRLANLSFSDLGDDELWVAPGVAAVHADSPGSDEYFPERTLARWFASRGSPRIIHAFVPSGVASLRVAYQWLATTYNLDAIVVVDGGTDMLLTGDESGLGTPIEDMTTLAAVNGLAAFRTRLAVSIGFGIDAYHGVNHTEVLENISTLTRDGAYLGAFSVPPDSDEATTYLDAVEHAARATPGRVSIVNGQIAASLRGRADIDGASRRTEGSALFVNALMNIYFAFDLDGLARSVHYLDTISDTATRGQVAEAIEAYRYDVPPRRPRPFPH